MSALETLLFEQRAVLDRATLNPKMRAIHERLVALEALRVDLEASIDELNRIGLERINEVFLPALARAKDVADVGSFFRTKSFTTQTVRFGDLTFSIGDDRRLLYAPTQTLFLRPAGTSGIYILAELLSYDRETGVLIVSSTETAGVGTYSDWDISPAVSGSVVDSALLDAANAFTAPQTIRAPDASLILIDEDAGSSFRMTGDGTEITLSYDLAAGGEFPIELLRLSPDVAKYLGSDLWHVENMGVGSGLDADLLDGFQADAFVQRAGNQDIAGDKVFSKTLTVRNSAPALQLDDTNQPGKALIQYDGGAVTVRTDSGGNGQFTASLLTIAQNVFRYLGNTIWHAGNGGHNSGMNADKLDGLEASAFVQSSGGPQRVSQGTGSPSLTAEQTSSSTGAIIQRWLSGAGRTLDLKQPDRTKPGDPFVFATGNAVSFQIDGVDALAIDENGGVQLLKVPTVGSDTVWTKRNMGAGSALDADKLDGIEAAGFVQLAGNQVVSGVKTFAETVVTKATCGDRRGVAQPILSNTSAFWSIPGHCWAFVTCSASSFRGVFFVGPDGVMNHTTAMSNSLNFMTGRLDGTTGPPNQVNVSSHNDKLWIENRTSTARTFAVTLLGSI